MNFRPSKAQVLVQNWMRMGGDWDFELPCNADNVDRRGVSAKRGDVNSEYVDRIGEYEFHQDPRVRDVVPGTEWHIDQIAKFRDISDAVPREGVFDP